jgi:hypothetical protein
MAAHHVLSLYASFQTSKTLRNQLAHPDIFYEGYWSPLIEEFRGKWQIASERLKFKSGRAIEFPGGTGTWRMASCQSS